MENFLRVKNFKEVVFVADVYVALLDAELCFRDERKNRWTSNRMSSSTVTTVKSSYNPYAIKSIVGKTSMKALAARAAAEVVSEKAKEVKPEPEIPDQVVSDDDGTVTLLGETN